MTTTTYLSRDHYNRRVLITEFDLTLDDGHTLHAYDTGSLPAFWHHGTPNLGTPPKPLFAASERLGIRWVFYDRPAYGGSTAKPGRRIGSAAEYVTAERTHGCTAQVEEREHNRRTGDVRFFPWIATLPDHPHWSTSQTRSNRPAFRSSSRIQ